ncbi:PadR family transcriptional regulator [Lactobacillus sp. R2/2]|nr:PadR family transcriptional regulator [Lactobacillus sp. R2/2]
MAIVIPNRLLDGIILSFIKRNNLYSRVITEQAKAVFGISEPTIYPVLRRLRNNRFLSVYSRPFQGRTRNYYQITSSGKSELKVIKKNGKFSALK